MITLSASEFIYFEFDKVEWLRDYEGVKVWEDLFGSGSSLVDMSIYFEVI